MKKLIPILILLIAYNNYGQTKDCTSFKTGTFRYVDKSMPFNIVRNDTLQIEKNMETGVEIHSTVKWTSECEYVLIYKKILNVHQDGSDIIGKQIFIEVIEIKDHWFKVRAKSDVMDQEIEFIKPE